MTSKLPSLLNCQTLKNILSKPTSIKFSIIEASFGKQSEDEFKNGHIPKAKYFDQLECTTPTKLIPRGLPEIKCFENLLTRLGVTNNHHVIIYDRSPFGFYASSRAWFLLKAYGHNSLSVLDGGFYKWMNDKNQIEAEKDNGQESQQEQAEKFRAKIDPGMWRKFDDIIENLKKPLYREQLVDARPKNLFYGANGGHIPNSLNVPYTQMFDATTGCLKPKEQLAEIYSKAGVNLSKPAVYTCQTGTTASTLAFVSHLLGQDPVSVYVGSFTEWSQKAPAELIVKDEPQHDTKSNAA
ncbi:unnamed protein product [Didymodactylos carnosus]|uniref:Rhodanese domain-containing protein n=1 Tax=Didymodactylos carnosus TaxID=1234261 RepID=A0A814IEZ3_9BILA|nr:unnamed protein product [Didymodactylos carnosus]CAF1022655.1 unnamed protein product [Didymodactylos carnosus]CAF3714000.1 unnamed protein product [Didymodactylos carnosus]CAF3793987.1 unnamed protein product [Didymodactylos carnosus]